MAPYHGECLCGNIKVTLKNEPVDSVVCYCKDCAKMASSPGAVSVVSKKEDVEFEGNPATYRTNKVVSGKEKTFYACPKCFTSVGCASEGMEGVTITKLGLYSTEDQLKLFPKGGFMDESKTVYTKKLSEFLGSSIKA